MTLSRKTEYCFTKQTLIQHFIKHFLSILWNNSCCNSVYMQFLPLFFCLFWSLDFSDVKLFNHILNCLINVMVCLLLFIYISWNKYKTYEWLHLCNSTSFHLVSFCIPTCIHDLSLYLSSQNTIKMAQTVWFLYPPYLHQPHPTLCRDKSGEV